MFGYFRNSARTDPEGARLRARLALAAAVSVLPFYVATSSYLVDSTGGAQSRDPYSNALSARVLAETGELDLSRYRDTLIYRSGDTELRWFEERDDGSLAPTGTPGTIGLGALFYLVIPSSDANVILPASIGAAVTTATAVALLAYAAFCAGHSATRSYVGSVAIGLSTPFLSVLSDAWWQHTVSVLFLAAAIAAAVNDARRVEGSLLALALLARPITSVAAATRGIYEAVRQRTARPVLEIGIPSGLGMLVLVAYNAAVFGRVSITGSYGSYPIDNLTGPSFSYGANILEGLFSPYRGVLIYTPAISIVIVGLVRAWRSLNTVERSLAVASLCYILVQFRVSYFSGGSAFFSYRNTLEAVTLLYLPGMRAYDEWISRTRPRKQAFWLLVGVGLVLQLVGSLGFSIEVEPVWRLFG